MKQRTRISILTAFSAFFILCFVLLSSCSMGGALSGKAYLEERGMSAIDIIGEAKYVYDMVVYTGENIDKNQSIQDEKGNIYYKAIDGELATFTHEELIAHLQAYFSDDFITEITDKNIYYNEKGEIYTAGTEGVSGIDYIDYEIKTIDKKHIIYKVTVFYNADWNGKNPSSFQMDQEQIGETWLFTDEKDFKWGKSPQ